MLIEINYFDISRLTCGVCMSLTVEWDRDKAVQNIRKHRVLMKKNNKSINDDMLAEYNFKDGHCSKFASRYAEGSNIVVLSPDVAKSFPDSESVNEALRLLIKIANQHKNISFPQ